MLAAATRENGRRRAWLTNRDVSFEATYFCPVLAVCSNIIQGDALSIRIGCASHEFPVLHEFIKFGFHSFSNSGGTLGCHGTSLKIVDA